MQRNLEGKGEGKENFKVRGKNSLSVCILAP